MSADPKRTCESHQSTGREWTGRNGCASAFVDCWRRGLPIST